jgi:hypothetical protein
LSALFTEPADEAFFAAIGRLTISWAHIEVGLDWLVRVAHHDLGGRERIEAQEPTALKRKVTYLRKAFRTLPELAAFADRFPPIADEIIDASVQRHDFIHGFVIHSLPGSGKAVMARIMPRDKSLKPFEATTADIMRAAVRASKIQALRFAEEVVKTACPPNRSPRVPRTR